MDATGPESGQLRALRRPEAPYPGTLHAGAVPTVRVDAGEFGATPAWRCEGAEHVLSAMDATREDAGVRIVLPHCALRLRDVVARGGLADGVAVTIAVSLLRGAREADAVDAAAGQWWVSADGRPLVALVGEDDWRAEARDLLDALASSAAPEAASALRTARGALVDARTTAQEATGAEDALFAVAAGAPLPIDPPRPLAEARHAMAVRAPRPADHLPGEPVIDGIGRLVDRDIAERLRGAVAVVAARLRRRPRRPGADATPSRRRGPWLLAAGVVGAVVIAGVAWPSATDRPAPAADPAEVSEGAAAPGSPPPDAASAPPASAPPSVQGDDDARDAVAAATGLLTTLAACPDDACVAGLWEAPDRARRPSAGPAAEVTLVDEYGGVAVVRATEASTAEIVVVVAADGKWLVREIYDLADQP